MSGKDSGSPGGKKFKDGAGAPKKAKAPRRAERTQTGEQAGTSAGGSNNPEQQQQPPQQQPQPPQQQHQGAHAVHPTPAETDLYRRQRKEGRKRK